MAIRNREKEPVEEHHSLEAHFGGGIPLALVAKLLASQPGIGQETNNLIEELIIHGEEEDDDSKDEMNGVEEMGEDAESENGNENGEQADNMVTVVTGDYDEVIIHMTEEELTEMRKEEHDGQGEGGEEEEVN